uniref:Large ribosomal subunit protein uL10 n=1 Tax=candidate division WOR-3 bacterium TaxID=2052148 RepID=A0A7C4Y533_UNCW3
MPSHKNIKTVEEIKERLKNNRVLLITDYTKLNVADFTTLRKELKKNNNIIKVYKNRLVKIALKEQFNNVEVDNYLKGVSAFIFSNDEVNTAKIIYEFSKKNENLKTKAILIDGKVYDKKMVDTLAKIPSKEELYTEIVSSVNAPLSTLVYIFDNLFTTLLFSLETIKNQKEDR